MPIRVLLIPLAILGLVALVLSVWSGLDGDWGRFILFVPGLVILVGLLVHSLRD